MREGHVGEEVANQVRCNYPPHLLDTHPECWGCFWQPEGLRNLLQTQIYTYSPNKTNMDQSCENHFSKQASKTDSLGNICSIYSARCRSFLLNAQLMLRNSSKYIKLFKTFGYLQDTQVLICKKQLFIYIVHARIYTSLVARLEEQTQLVYVLAVYPWKWHNKQCYFLPGFISLLFICFNLLVFSINKMLLFHPSIAYIPNSQLG